MCQEYWLRNNPCQRPCFLWLIWQTGRQISRAYFCNNSACGVWAPVRWKLKVKTASLRGATLGPLVVGKLHMFGYFTSLVTILYCPPPSYTLFKLFHFYIVCFHRRRLGRSTAELIRLRKGKIQLAKLARKSPTMQLAKGNMMCKQTNGQNEHDWVVIRI